jgi:hypothetical protein
MTDWSEFRITNKEMEHIFEYIRSRDKAVPTEEIVNLVSRYKTEAQYGARPYSSKDKYAVGERIVFVTKDGCAAQATVVNVSEQQYFSIPQDKNVTGDSIEVKFIDAKWKVVFPDRLYPPKDFISNSPKYVLEKMKLMTFEVPEKQKETAAKKLDEHLEESNSVVKTKNGWISKEFLPKIEKEWIDEIYDLLVSTHHQGDFDISTEYMVDHIIGVKHTDYDYQLWKLALEEILSNYQRFMKETDTQENIWRLAPPPREVRINLSQEMIDLGSIPITHSLQHILDYYGKKNDTVLVIYGEYKIEGIINTDNKCIVGGDIQDWFIENELSEDDKIYIRCPQEGETDLRLFTFLESEKLGPTQGKGGRHYFGLRKVIYAVLLKEGKFLHISVISEKVSERLGQQVDPSKVSTTLSKNPHQFARLYSESGVWGLAEWTKDERNARIDLNSLLLAFGEEDWVYRIIEENGSPLSTRNIATKLAQEFVLNVDTVLSITFVNPKDKRIIRISERWALRSWVNEWLREKVEIEKKLDEIERKEVEFTGCHRRLEILEIELQKHRDEYDKISNELNAWQILLQSLKEKIDTLQHQLATKQNESHIKGAQKHSFQFFFYLISLFVTVITLRWRKKGNTKESYESIELRRKQNELEKLTKILQETENEIKTGNEELISISRRIPELNSQQQDLELKLNILQSEINQANREGLLNRKMTLLNLLGEEGGNHV